MPPKNNTKEKLGTNDKSKQENKKQTVQSFEVATTFNFNMNVFKTEGGHFETINLPF